jgi:hypothetical protein
MDMQPANRTTLYQKFVARFRPATSDYRIVSVTSNDIEAAESAIGSKLPASYRTFVTEFGAGDNDVPEDPIFAVAEIWDPRTIVRQVHEEWLAPIPACLNDGVPVASDVAWKYLTPFASEQSHGHWFCFPRTVAASDDAPVFYFNHDGGDIERIADDFDDMIQRILGGTATN